MAVQCLRDDDVDLQRDRALVEQCQSGDAHAFDLLYMRYYERLKRFCIRRIGDRDESEDVVQEAFARAWKALPAFSGDKRFYPWLSVIAGNLCTDTLRKRARNTPVPDQELDAARAAAGTLGSTDEDRILEAVDADLACKALDRISPRHREVLMQRETREWTYQQIADFHGVRITTVEALIWRARRSLKREFTALSGSESLGVVGILTVAWRQFARRVRSVGLRGVRHGSQVSAGSTAAPAGAAPHLLPTAALPMAGAIAAAGTSVVLLVGGIGGTTAPSVNLPAAGPAATAGSTAPQAGAPSGGSTNGVLNGAGSQTGTVHGAGSALGTLGGSRSTSALGALGGSGVASATGAAGATGSQAAGTVSGLLGGGPGGLAGGFSPSVNSAVKGGLPNGLSPPSSLTSSAGPTVSGAVSAATGAVSWAVSGVATAVSSATSTVSSGVAGILGSAGSTVTSVTAPAVPTTIGPTPPPVTVPPVTIPPASTSTPIAGTSAPTAPVASSGTSSASASPVPGIATVVGTVTSGI